jgi:hypothetical protein
MPADHVPRAGEQPAVRGAADQEQPVVGVEDQRGDADGRGVVHPEDPMEDKS